MIDSWENGEKAGVSIEGIEVWSHTNYARESCDNLWNHGFYEPWSGSGGRVCYYDVDVTVDHTGPSATIAMYATINGQSKCTLSLSLCVATPSAVVCLNLRQLECHRITILTRFVFLFYSSG